MTIAKYSQPLTTIIEILKIMQHERFIWLPIVSRIHDLQIENSHVENKSSYNAIPLKLNIFLYQSSCGNNVWQQNNYLKMLVSREYLKVKFGQLKNIRSHIIYMHSVCMHNKLHIPVCSAHTVYYIYMYPIYGVNKKVHIWSE